MCSTPLRAKQTARQTGRKSSKYQGHRQCGNAELVPRQIEAGFRMTVRANQMYGRYGASVFSFEENI